MAVRVDSFLGCFRLETGAKIIAWLSIVIWAILLGASALGYGLFSSKLDYMMLLFETRHKFSSDKQVHDIENVVFMITIALLIFAVVVLTVMSMFGIYFSYQLLKGIKERNSRKMKSYIIISSCNNIFPLVDLLCGDIEQLIPLVIEIYICIVLFSLYQQFVDEEKSNLINHGMNMATATVSNNRVSPQVNFTNPMSTIENPYVQFKTTSPSYNNA